MRRRLAAALAIAIASPAFAGTINVPADQPTIQAGLDAAAEGETVLVAAGTYAEAVVVGRQAIALIADGTVVLKPGAGRVGISVTTTDVVVDGFTVQKCATGIKVTGASGTQVRNCVVQACSADGIRVDGGSSVRVDDCTVSKVKADGIAFGVGTTPVDDSFITHCTVSTCGGDGIDVNGSHTLVADCTVSKTKEEGIELTFQGSVLNCTVRDNRVSKAKRWGILVTGGEHVVTGNRVEKCGYDCMDVNGYGSEIGTNTFVKPKGDGFWTDATGLNIHDNVVESPKGDGFQIDGAGNTLTNNTVHKAKFTGFEINSANNVITGNTSTDARKGDLEDSFGAGSNTYSNNTFTRSNLP